MSAKNIHSSIHTIINFTIVLSFLSQSFFYDHQLNAQSSDFGFGNWYSGSKNFVEVTYGIGDLNHKDFKAKFNSLSMSEIKLGRRFSKPAAGFKIIEFNDNYLFSSYINHFEDGNSSDNLKIDYDIWRFGFGYKKGYGYNLNGFAILPYYHSGLVWNRSKFTHPSEFIMEFAPTDYSTDLDVLTKYNDVIKFGTNNIAGIDFKLSNLIAIGASYETAVLFPYHKFWKQTGSFFIETLAQTGIDFLTEGVIIKEIPGAAPILYFVLKNGLSYFLYTLKQDDMNWPFSTAKPITLEAIKFSLKVTF
jgi:hypothetical protein